MPFAVNGSLARPKQDRHHDHARGLHTRITFVKPMLLQSGQVIPPALPFTAFIRDLPELEVLHPNYCPPVTFPADLTTEPLEAPEKRDNSAVAYDRKNHEGCHDHSISQRSSPPLRCEQDQLTTFAIRRR